MALISAGGGLLFTGTGLARLKWARPGGREYMKPSLLLPGCAAVDAFIADNLNLLQSFWEYAYSNPTFNPDAVCPF